VAAHHAATLFWFLIFPDTSGESYKLFEDQICQIVNQKNI